METIIKINRVPTYGLYATIEQGEFFMQYPQKISRVVLYTIKNGEYVRLGNLVVTDNMKFQVNNHPVQKIPVKRKEKITKKDKIKFFFISNTLFLEDNGINLIGPYYSKVDVKEGKEFYLNSSNFALEESWYWDGGYYSHYLWDDYQERMKIYSDARQKIEKLFLSGLNLDNMQIQIDTFEMALKAIKACNIWWRRATVTEILKKYHKTLLF